MRSFLTLLFVFSISILCYGQNTLTSRVLDQNWSFKALEDSSWLRASVPGTIHTDLMANGIIEDPYYRLNERKVQWVDKKDWVYQCAFEISAEEFVRHHHELQFEGLDTYASVYINDRLILQSSNMHRSYSVDVKEYLIEGSNTLRILLESPIKRGLELYDALDYTIPVSANDQAETGEVPGGKRVNVFTRKAAYHYGWDWGPRLVTSGIWRPITLLSWDDFRISELLLTSQLNGDVAAVMAQIEIESKIENANAALQLKLDDDIIASTKLRLNKGKQKFNLPIKIDRPELWWPNGLGRQHLYNIEVKLQRKEVISTVNQSIGIRNIELVADSTLSQPNFYFKVNGAPTFAKGVNYIPQDLFLPRVSTKDYERILQAAADANMNMIRVWGGGVYENDRFYELCDSLGLMVWQDFMFACAVYPGDSAFLDNVKHEAIDNIKRLRKHPSLALWCGNNESLSAWENWGWKEQVAREESQEIADSIWRSYEKLFHQILHEAVTTYDEGRPYWTSSPSSDFGKKESYDSGDVHYWWVWWGKKPFEDYNDAIPRFMSEYGFQSFPEFRSVQRYTAPSDHDVYSEVMTSHQRSSIGNETIEEYMLRDFKKPKDFPSFLYVSQLLQAHGLKMAIEAHRRHRDRCMGTLYWQLNDCWPVASWSSIDYFHSWKALQYRVKEAFRPYLVSHEIQKDSLHLYVVSDELLPKEATLSMQLMDFYGKESMNASMPLRTPLVIQANQSSIYHSLDMRDIEALGPLNTMLLKVQVQDVGGEILAENTIYFTAPKALSLPKPRVKFSVQENEDEYMVVLSTDHLAKNLHITSELVGNFSNNFFDLLPGESKMVSIPKSAGSDLNSFRASIAVQTLVDSY